MTFQHERFRDLIAVVEAVPEKQFNMDYFGTKDSCGTIACAVGWYSLTFPDRLRHTWRIGSVTDSMDLGWRDIEFHFGLSVYEADRCFEPSSYVNKDKCTVLARLIQFYNDHCPADARLPEVSSEIPEGREKEAEPAQVQGGSTVSRSGHGITIRPCPDFSIPV